MKKTTLAFSVLMALSLTACSGGGGGGSASPNTSTPANTTTVENSPIRTETVSANQNENTTPAKSDVVTEDPTPAETSTVQSLPEDNSPALAGSTSEEGVILLDVAPPEPIVPTQLITGVNPTASDASSALYKYLNSDTETLLSAIDSVKVATLPATCSNTASGACSLVNKAQGEVVLAKAQSYSSYAIVRENYHLENVPVNAFVAVNHAPTLAENKATALNATYTGQATLSPKNHANAFTRPFELVVAENSVNGTVTSTTNGEKNVLVRLNDGAISVEQGVVTFSGGATFNQKVFGVEEGSYQGSFAGKNAEEVVGTFGSHEFSNAGSVQGAFAGTKNE